MINDTIRALQTRTASGNGFVYTLDISFLICANVYNLLLTDSHIKNTLP